MYVTHHNIRVKSTVKVSLQTLSRRNLKKKLQTRFRVFSWREKKHFQWATTLVNMCEWLLEISNCKIFQHFFFTFCSRRNFLQICRKTQNIDQSRSTTLKRHFLRDSTHRWTRRKSEGPCFSTKLGVLKIEI